MLALEIVSDREVSIDGIGILKPGEPVELDEEKLMFFEILNGTSVMDANFPSFIGLTTVIKNGGE